MIIIHLLLDNNIFKVMVLNAIFNNISVIFLQSVLLVGEIRVPGENHQRATSH